MTRDAEEISNEVWSHFKDMQVIFLATVEGSRPRVRPVTLIHFDRKMWVTTGSGDKKVRQIRANSSIEFCLLLKTGENSGYVRCVAEAEIVTDPATRALVADKAPFFKEFWKTADDPEYALLRLHPRHIEYVRPGAITAEWFSVA